MKHPDHATAEQCCATLTLWSNAVLPSLCSMGPFHLASLPLRDKTKQKTQNLYFENHGSWDGPKCRWEKQGRREETLIWLSLNSKILALKSGLLPLCCLIHRHRPPLFWASLNPGNHLWHSVFLSPRSVHHWVLVTLPSKCISDSPTAPNSVPTTSFLLWSTAVL